MPFLGKLDVEINLTALYLVSRGERLYLKKWTLFMVNIQIRERQFVKRSLRFPTTPGFNPRLRFNGIS